MQTPRRQLSTSPHSGRQKGAQPKNRRPKAGKNPAEQTKIRLTPNTFVSSLFEWYEKYGRHQLPWRQTRDPYFIWVSETMLQQTQVSRVAKDYYPRFIEKFPTVGSLAQTKWEDLWPYWKGLGFYSRGKNFLRSAKIIQTQLDGKLPTSKTEWLNLPGVGPYTAAAIMSFAHNEPELAVDVNLEKLLKALFPKLKPSVSGENLLALSPSSHGFHSAMMDLASFLRSRRMPEGALGKVLPKNIIDVFKPKRKNPNRPKRAINTVEVGVACIYDNGKYLIQTRPKGKSFSGKWEFPGGKREKGEDFRACVKREIEEELGVEVSVRPAFFEEFHPSPAGGLRLVFHRCQIQSGDLAPQEKQKIQWVAPADFDTIDFLKADDSVLTKLAAMRLPK